MLPHIPGSVGVFRTKPHFRVCIRACSEKNVEMHATLHSLLQLSRVMHACYGVGLHCRAALRENKVISLEDVFGFALDGTYLRDFEIDMM